MSTPPHVAPSGLDLNSPTGLVAGTDVAAALGAAELIREAIPWESCSVGRGPVRGGFEAPLQSEGP